MTDTVVIFEPKKALAALHALLYVKASRELKQKWHDEIAAHLKLIQRVVDEQANDDGLWFVAETAPEAYLQQELRRLHTVIEAGRDARRD